MPRLHLHPSSGTGIISPYTKAIRLARYGCANRPFYHIVVMDVSIKYIILDNSISRTSSNISNYFDYIFFLFFSDSWNKYDLKVIRRKKLRQI